MLIHHNYRQKTEEISQVANMGMSTLTVAMTGVMIDEMMGSPPFNPPIQC